MNTRDAILAIAVAAFMTGAGATDKVTSQPAHPIAQGDRLWAEGKIEEAGKSFEKAVAEAPRSVEARMKLGGLLLASRQYGAAIANYQQTLSLDDKNARAWIGLGMAYLHTGQKPLARAAFESAVQVEPARKAQLAQLLQKTE